MDLTEFSLSEQSRQLRRMGLLHVWAPQGHKTRTAPLRAQKPLRQPPVPIESTPVPKQQKVNIPRPLQILFHRKHLPVHALWSYPELTADIYATTPAARFQLLGTIMRAAVSHLGWEQNRHCLWPLTGELSIIQGGLEQIRPQRVLFFGDCQKIPEAVRSLLSSAALVPVELPDLAPMVTGDQGAKNTAWKIFQSLHFQ